MKRSRWTIIQTVIQMKRTLNNCNIFQSTTITFCWKHLKTFCYIFIWNLKKNKNKKKVVDCIYKKYRTLCCYNETYCFAFPFLFFFFDADQRAKTHSCHMSVQGWCREWIINDFENRNRLKSNRSLIQVILRLIHLSSYQMLVAAATALWSSNQQQSNSSSYLLPPNTFNRKENFCDQWDKHFSSTNQFNEHQALVNATAFFPLAAYHPAATAAMTVMATFSNQLFNNTQAHVSVPSSSSSFSISSL